MVFGFTFCLCLLLQLITDSCCKHKIDSVLIFTLSIPLCAYVNNSNLIQPSSHTFLVHSLYFENTTCFGHAALFRDFVEAVETGRDPLISGESGKKALEIILAIYKSQKTGQPVDLPCDFSTL